MQQKKNFGKRKYEYHHSITYDDVNERVCCCCCFFSLYLSFISEILENIYEKKINDKIDHYIFCILESTVIVRSADRYWMKWNEIDSLFSVMVYIQSFFFFTLLSAHTHTHNLRFKLTISIISILFSFLFLQFQMIV